MSLPLTFKLRYCKCMYGGNNIKQQCYFLCWLKDKFIIIFFHFTKTTFKRNFYIYLSLAGFYIVASSFVQSQLNFSQKIDVFLFSWVSMTQNWNFNKIQDKLWLWKEFLSVELKWNWRWVFEKFQWIGMFVKVSQWTNVNGSFEVQLSGTNFFDNLWSVARLLHLKMILYIC